jgi:amidohydrolase
MTFLEDAAGLADELRSLRRALHADPELGLELPRTQRRVLDALDGLGLEVTLGVSSTAVTAVLRGERPGPVVLLRGDMDALPVAEETGLDFASTNGAMHACGHDLHVTGLVGAAKLLAARRDELPGSVIFMFQPGEEADGGAVRMIEEGVLDAAGERPVAAYGVHVATGRFGVVETRAGTLMAGANELYVTVNGRGGHGSQPVTSVDPVPALLEIGLALQTMVTRRFSVFDPVVVTVTQLSAGQAVNVIPPAARLGATVRTLSQASVETLRGGSSRRCRPRGAALDGEQLGVDRASPAVRACGGDRPGEGGREVGVLGLGGEGLGPVEREVEVAAAVVDLADAAGRGLVSSRKVPVAASRVSARTGRARRCRCGRRGARRTRPARGTRRGCPSAGSSPSTNCCTCLGAEPPAPVSKRPPPFISGTTESILARRAELEDREEVGVVVAQDVAGDRDGVLARRMRSSEVQARLGGAIVMSRPSVSWSGGTSRPWR